jgi:hypothetical protein
LPRKVAFVLLVPGDDRRKAGMYDDAFARGLGDDDDDDDEGGGSVVS